MAQGNIAGRGGMFGAGVLVPTAPAVTLLFLNLLDGLFTLVYLQMGVAQEANPLMRVAYEVSPMWFMLVKLLIVNFGVLVLNAYREARIAQIALKIALAMYALIVTWHLAFLAFLLTR